MRRPAALNKLSLTSGLAELPGKLQLQLQGAEPALGWARAWAILATYGSA